MARTDARSTSQVVKDATSNLQALARAEVDLAKVELRDELSKLATGIGVALVGALLGLFVLGFAGVTVAKALEESFAPWIAWLITTGGVLVVAGLLAFVGGRIASRTTLPPPKTTNSIKETVAWARTQTRR